MTITYPRDLPVDHRIVSVSLYPGWQQSAGMTRGGLYQVADLGPMIWLAKIKTAAMRPEHYAAWRGWIASLRGGMMPFWLHDCRHPYPVAHRSGFAGMVRAIGGDFNGMATLDSVSEVDSHVIGIVGLPGNFILSPGDWLSFDYSSGVRRALHRVTEGGQVDSLGEVSLTVEPAIRTGWLAGTDVQLNRAAAAMVLDPKSISEGGSGVGWGQRVISFNATQTLVTS